jgi:hypothetical protein
MYSVFHTLQLSFVERRSSVSELHNTFGINIEELLRHHPPLLPLCMNALVNEIVLITNIAEEYSGLTMEDAVSGHALCSGVKFTSILQFVHGILSTLESILTKKENVTAFISLNGVEVLCNLLAAAHKPRRYILASFSCITESNSYSLGHHPIVKVCC